MAKPNSVRTISSRLAQRLAMDLCCLACHFSTYQANQPVTVMGLPFPSPLGIAAGFDRYSRLGRRAALLGFGFNEVGSLTADGFARLSPVKDGQARLGLSLTLDASQSWTETCALLQTAWPLADYLVLNLIGPASVRLVEDPDRLHRLLSLLRHQQHALNTAGNRSVPLLAKLRCLPEQVPEYLTEVLLELGFDGLIAAHDPGPPATRQRYRAWQDDRQQMQACMQIEQLHRLCGTDLALISVGGVQTAGHLQARLDAGAQLIQVHGALMRQGPWLARRLCG